MSKLDEIENAAAELPPEQKQQLMLFLAKRLRSDGARPPEPRQFSREQIDRWVAEDEAEMRLSRAGNAALSRHERVDCRE